MADGHYQHAIIQHLFTNEYIVVLIYLNSRSFYINRCSRISLIGLAVFSNTLGHRICQKIKPSITVPIALYGETKFICVMDPAVNFSLLKLEKNYTTARL